jgi:hypothetical protein
MMHSLTHKAVTNVFFASASNLLADLLYTHSHRRPITERCFYIIIIGCDKKTRARRYVRKGARGQNRLPWNAMPKKACCSYEKYGIGI